MRELSGCGSGGCVACPFSYNDISEQVQNYACLPDSFDIIKMKEKSGHNWACHSDESIVCSGLATYIKKSRPDLDIKVGNLISYETWYHKGEEKALDMAHER